MPIPPDDFLTSPSSDHLANRTAAELPAESPGNSLWQRAVLLTQKELRETLRDRRTIITLLAMPILMYPLLGLTFRMLAVNQLTAPQGQPQFTIVLGSDVEALWLKSAIELGEQMLDDGRRTDSETPAGEVQSPAPLPQHPATSASSEQLLEAPADAPQSLPVDPGLSPGLAPLNTDSADPARQFRLVVPENERSFDLESSVASAEADLGVVVALESWNGQLQSLQSAKVTVVVNENSVNSRDAQRQLEERLQAANQGFLLEVVRQHAPDTRLPVQVEQREIASTQKTRGFLGLLPLVLMLMTVTGGVYPAIDLTAGERERDTLETLIALPVPTVHLLLAKYVAVFSVTMITGMINLIAMTATVYALRMETQLFGTDGIHPGLAAALILIQIVFGLFYSAVLLAITSSSRSFKEAQAYLIPLMLMSIAPGLSILLPGWHLQGIIAVVPLVNMLLLARDLFEGSVQLLPAMAAVVSTLIYAASALLLAARMFGRDAVALGSRGSWSDLVRRPDQGTACLKLMPGVLTLAMMFPLYFFANGLLGRIAGADAPNARLLSSALMTIVLFVVIPSAIALWLRCPLKTALQIRWTRMAVWPLVALLGIGTWPWIYEMVMATQQLGVARIDPERLKQVSEILERWQNVPLAMMVICLGIVPGVCEELFFRGYLLGTMRDSLRPAVSIALCGVVFGLFHVVAAEGATLERLLPSTVLGWLLSWIAVRTGSVLPGMLMHGLHNSSLLVLAHYREELSNLSLGGVQQQHLPLTWLVASALMIGVGITGLWFIVRRPDIRVVADPADSDGR